MKKSKSYIEKTKKIDKSKKYSPNEAIHLLKKFDTKFNESVEIHFNLGIDPRHADQQLRGTYTLPHGTGRDIKLLVISDGENKDKALAAGADFAGFTEYIERIQKGWFEFDLIITTPDMMRHLGKLGKTLGSKGLMPSPKSGTVTTDVEKAVFEFKSGKFEYRNDKNGIVHLTVGKVSFSEDMLFENIENLFDFFIKIKPPKAKGTYYKSISLCTTQSPSFFLETMKTKWDVKNDK